MILLVQRATSGNPTRQAEYHRTLRDNRRLRGVFQKVVTLEGRPTFREMFAYASAHFPGQIVILSNSDISFDTSILVAKTHLKKGEVWALTRWEPKAQLPCAMWGNSQDAWVFRTPIKDIARAEFTLGVWACDNAIARILQDEGFKVTNPSLTVKITHRHASQVRTSAIDVKIAPLIEGEGLFVAPTSLT